MHSDCLVLLRDNVFFAALAKCLFIQVMCVVNFYDDSIVDHYLYDLRLSQHFIETVISLQVFMNTLCLITFSCFTFVL